MGPLYQESIETTAVAPGLDAVYSLLQGFWYAIEQLLPGNLSAEWQMEFTNASIEVATNIIRHAYPADARERPLAYALRLYHDRVECEFTDAGEPYREMGLPATGEADLGDLREGGFGLLIARSSVDVLRHEHTPDGLNRWTLIKSLGAGSLLEEADEQ